MEQPFDEYADQFLVNVGAFGASLVFQRADAIPAGPGGQRESQELGTIRMSVEHLKSMVFMLKRQVDAYEGRSGISYPVPVTVLNNLRIAPEDWESFWGGSAAND